MPAMSCTPSICAPLLPLKHTQHTHTLSLSLSLSRYALFFAPVPYIFTPYHTFNSVYNLTPPPPPCQIANISNSTNSTVSAAQSAKPIHIRHKHQHIQFTTLHPQHTANKVRTPSLCWPLINMSFQAIPTQLRLCWPKWCAIARLTITIWAKLLFNFTVKVGLKALGPRRARTHRPSLCWPLIYMSFHAFPTQLCERRSPENTGPRACAHAKSSVLPATIQQLNTVSALAKVLRNRLTIRPNM